ncbi:MAG: selenide, water dikinase SelD [Pirellulales bacterium]|nr:selenide, water dikinase SelD [Pirellulales bacterium]
MQLGSPAPIAKSVVLVGAGNAHLVFARRFAMRPIPGVSVTLVNQGNEIPYSAMVPAHIGREFTADQISFDLVRMAAGFGLRLVSEPVCKIETGRRQVVFEQRPPIKYDILSLGLGSIPAAPEGLIDGKSAFVMRPLAKLIKRLSALEAELQANPRPFHLAVVGGGASGCELALAIAKRMSGISSFRITLLQANQQLLPTFPDRTTRHFARELQARAINVRTSARVVGGNPTELQLETGENVSCDQVLWATQASAAELIREAGLSVTEHGFLRIRKTLQSVSESDVFGTGDCASFDDYPQLAKSGVYAVREGRVLYDNIRRRLRDQPLRDFRPQKRVLYLLNTADGGAVLNYGAFAWKSKAARKLKNWIDQRWVQKFTVFPEMGDTDEENAEDVMRCGGCGSKVPAHVLSNVLKDLTAKDDPRVLVGLKDGDDAAVFRLPTTDQAGAQQSSQSDDNELVEVQTVDYFKSFLNDPYLFGRMAALNAASDLYAMNAQPQTALAIATLPFARTPIQEAQLQELMAGASESLREMEITLAGGHTTEGTELAMGFAMTGFARRGRLFRKSGLRPGNTLILTKPLGTGALLAALMQSECKAAWYEPLLEEMLKANKDAAAIMAEFGVVSCTDVTGFGLAGHLLEMLDASGVSAKIAIDHVPIYEGFTDVTALGIRSTLFEDNARVASRVRGNNPPDWLFDPQTSGGLIAGVTQDQADDVLARLRSSDYTFAARIGVIDQADGSSPMIVLE